MTRIEAFPENTRVVLPAGEVEEERGVVLSYDAESDTYVVLVDTAVDEDYDDRLREVPGTPEYIVLEQP